MKFRTAYKDKIQSPFNTVGDSMTKQSMMAECNINFIIDRFQKTGMIEHEKKYEGDYGEFDSIDFHEAMNIVAEAKSMFETVPSNVRKQFNNDPGEFLNFVRNKENEPEMAKLGLLDPSYALEPEVTITPAETHQPITEQSEEKSAD